MTKRKTRKDKRKTRKNKIRKTKKVRGGKSKSLGWEKKVANVITNKSKETHYSHLCKYFYKNEDDKRTHDTHLITTDDPKLECDDASIIEAIAKETDLKKRKRLTEIQDSKKKFEESIQKKIENILKEREEEKARKAGEEADVTALIQGEKTKKADEQELNQQLDIASKNTEEQRRIGEANRIKREEKAKVRQKFKNLIEKQIITTKEEKKEKEEKGLFGEYTTKANQTKYFYINPYDKDANCNPEKNKSNADFKDLLTQNDLNGCNIVQLGKHCYDINSVIQGFNGNNRNRNFPSNLGLTIATYKKNLVKIIGKIDYLNTPYTERDVTYLTNFITKLLEKGEDPFAPPQE
jgi:hypothetical protein